MKVKELREKYKLTQAALAKSLGVSSITISAVETGRTKLSKHLSARIQEVYGEVVEPEIRKVKTAEKAAAKKTGTAKKKAAAAEVGDKIEKKAKRTKKAKVVIQSPMGGEITTEDILKKIGEAETVYVRVDQNKAYWVKGDETGSVELW